MPMHMPTAVFLLLAAPPEPRMQVRAELVAGRLAGALTAARPWAAGTPHERACYAALLEADGRLEEAAALKKDLPAPPAAPAPASAAPAPGSKAWVSASTLALRREPKPTALAVAMLPIGAEVQVLAVDTGFARVRTQAAVRPGRLLVLQAGDHGYVAEDEGGSLEGWAAGAYLSPAPPDAAALRKQAGGPDREAAATALERLAGLERTPEAWALLAGAAFDAGRCSIAANAAGELARARRTYAGWALDGMQLAYRCRGDVSRATLFTPAGAQLKRKKVPKDACVVNVNPQPDCGFCPLEYDDESSPKAKRDQASAERREAAREARFEAIHALFPNGPYLRLQLRRTVGTVEPMVLATISEQAQACGELPEPQLVERLPLQLPNLRAGEALDLWLEVGPYEAHAFEVLPAAAFDPAFKAYDTAVSEWKKTHATETPAFALGLGWRVNGPPLVNCCCD